MDLMKSSSTMSASPMRLAFSFRCPTPRRTESKPSPDFSRRRKIGLLLTMSFWLRTSLVMSVGISMIPGLGKNLKTSSQIWIIYPRCSTLRDSRYGIPGYRIPVANPHEIVYRSLKRAQERTQLAPTRFRPWLQAFRDYAFDKRYFKDKEIRDQINAATEFGSGGWMLWNPSNVYSSSGLKKEESLSEEDLVSFLSKNHRTVSF